MAYEWDIFLSYPRAGQVGQWVHEHFSPLLRDCLEVHLAEAPRIFVDEQQPTGVEWPQNIQTALLRSRLLVAVWTPPYFRSEWCTAEWVSMLEREQALDRTGVKPARGLVYPVVYSDGKHFDERAKATQYKNLSAFTFPYPGYRESVGYLAFHENMMAIAAEIEEHLDQIPAWQPDWPIAVPALAPPRRLALAKL